MSEKAADFGRGSAHLVRAQNEVPESENFEKNPGAILPVAKAFCNAG